MRKQLLWLGLVLACALTHVPAEARMLFDPAGTGRLYPGLRNGFLPLPPVRPLLGGIGTPGTAAEVAAGLADFVAGRTSTNQLAIAVSPGRPLYGFSNSVRTIAANTNTCFTFDPAVYPGRFDVGDMMKVASAAALATNEYTLAGQGAVTSFDNVAHQVCATFPSATTFGANQTASDWVLIRHLPPYSDFSTTQAQLYKTNAAAGTKVVDWDFRYLMTYGVQGPSSFAGESWQNPFVFDQCLFGLGESFTSIQRGQVGLLSGSSPYALRHSTISYDFASYGSTATVTSAPGASLTLSVDAIPAPVKTYASQVTRSGTDGYAGIRIMDVTRPDQMQGTWVFNMDTAANTITLKDDQYGRDGPADLSGVQQNDIVRLWPQAGYTVIFAGAFVDVASNDIAATDDIFEGYPEFAPVGGVFTQQISVRGNRFKQWGTLPARHADYDQFGELQGAASITHSNNVIDATKTPGVNAGGNPRQIFQAVVNGPTTVPYEFRNSIILGARVAMLRTFGYTNPGFVQSVTQGASNGAGGFLAHVKLVAGATVFAATANTTGSTALLSGIKSYPGLSGTVGATNVVVASNEFDAVGSLYVADYALPGTVTTQASITPAGSGTITVTDASNLVAGMVLPIAGSYTGNKSYVSAVAVTGIKSIVGNVLTLTVPTTGAIPAGTALQFAPGAVSPQIAPVSIHDVYFQGLAGANVFSAEGGPPQINKRQAFSAYNLQDYDGVVATPANDNRLTFDFGDGSGPTKAYQRVSVTGLTLTPIAGTSDVQLVIAADGTPTGWQVSTDGGASWAALAATLRMTMPARGTAYNLMVRSTNAPGTDGVPTQFGPASSVAGVTTSP